jgi:hypothetical protein
MDSDEKCPDCEEVWAVCECVAYCEECGKHEEKCLCVGDDDEWEIETDDDE